MFGVAGSIVIERPIADVFAFMADFQHEPEWNPVVLEAMKTSAGPIQVGTTFHEVSRLLGQRVEANYQVTEYEPGQLFAIRSTSGPLQVTLHYTFASVPDGTQLTSTGEGRPLGLFRLAEPLLARMIRDQVEAGLHRVKQRLEAS